jgi:murein DD-endopeptidase MepM/ murein hydrolase activator NlpD
MQRKRRWPKFLLVTFLFAFFISLILHDLQMTGGYGRLQAASVIQGGFRQHSMSQELLPLLQTSSDPGKLAGLYLLDTNFGADAFSSSLTESSFQELEKRWSTQEDWETYLEQCRLIWNDVSYFPVAEATNQPSYTVSYVDSWMFDRTYGTTRGHEGTDLMASENTRGLYPIVSMTDGVVRHKGWLELGGWRIGIATPSGAYFYYAHMDSYADLEVGDTVKAGQLLGYMGDSGYSKVEGTTGNFDVHLHLGIYIFYEDEEVSINPYWILKYAEQRKINCVYSQ